MGDWYYDQMSKAWINRKTGARSSTKPTNMGGTAVASPHYPSRSGASTAASHYPVSPYFSGNRAPTGYQSQRTSPEYAARMSTVQHMAAGAMPGSILAPRPTSVYGTGGGGGGGGSVAAGPAIDPNAGKALPALPPELQRWYEEQLSGARTAEDVAIAQARTAQRAALLQAAAQRNAATRAMETGAVDVGAAMSSLGLGSSPALMGAALDEVYGTGGAGMLSADAARTAALENFLRAQEEAVGTGRRRKSELEDWRALQIAALANEDLAKLIGMSPGGTK